MVWLLILLGISYLLFIGHLVKAAFQIVQLTSRMDRLLTLFPGSP